MIAVFLLIGLKISLPCSPPFLDLLSDLLILEYSLQTGQKTGQIYATLLVRISELVAPRALSFKTS